MQGTFSLMLHCHIPYCRKSGVWPAGEEWLFEAMNETYIPLLMVLRSLQLDGIRSGMMVGIVPVLMEQLSDTYMMDRFCAYMEDKIERARNDINRFESEPAKRNVAYDHLKRFENNYHAFLYDFHRDILGTFKWLQNQRQVEVLTSAATHGFLPLMEHASSVFTQIRIGVETYKRHFDTKPRGFWLPECAYRPGRPSHTQIESMGIDDWLVKEGIEYFFTEDVGITRASFTKNLHQEDTPTTYRGYSLDSGACVFGRNKATGEQVWSPHKGYPGDPYYLEFHRKDHESGLHYWRVTGDDEKQIYDPVAAQERARVHAGHFVDLLEQLAGQTDIEGTGPIMVCPYDCELFGHWWHEGPAWLDNVYRLINDKKCVKPMALGEYIDQSSASFSTISMQPSTWGLNSDYTVWQNPEHGWIWPYINSSTHEFEQLLADISPQDERGGRILRQIARELLLMQGSDWPFLLFTEQAKDYANQRFHHHHQRFQKLMWAAKDLQDHKRLSEEELHQIEDVDCPWGNIDYTLFSSYPSDK